MGEVTMRKKLIILIVCMCMFMGITQVNIYAEEPVATDLEEIEIEYDDDFLLLQTLGMNTISWKIKNNLEKRGKVFKGKKNQIVALNLKLGTTKNVKAGVRTMSGNIIYLSSEENVKKNVVIQRADDYVVFVRNKSGKTINVSGGYSF